MPVDRQRLPVQVVHGQAMHNYSRLKVREQRPLQSQGPAFVFVNAIHLLWGDEHVQMDE
jgi:hypothetical protein